MIEWVKKHKISSIIIVFVVLLFFMIIIPLVINWLYYINAPCNFLYVKYEVADILSYYGDVLTFIGTVSLGLFTVYQNYISQRKTDEVNKLTLELQKKSMALAEQAYEKDKKIELKSNSPKFEIRNTGSNGNYMNLSAILKNVSDIIVSGIKSISFEVITSDNETLITSDKVYSKVYSLTPGQETEIQFHNAEIKSKDSIASNGQQVYDGVKNCTIVWKYKCEDSMDNTHYYKASLLIEDSRNYKGELWEVKKVG